MKAFYLILATVALVVFTACGGSSGSNNDTSSSSQASTQSSEAAQSSSEAGSSSSTAQSSSEAASSSSIASAGSAPAKTLKSLAAASTFLSQSTTTGLVDSLSSLQGITSGAAQLRAIPLNSCTSGSASLDYSATSITIIFDQCATGTSTMNGTMSVANATATTPSYTFTNFTMVTPENTVFFNATITASTNLSGSTLVSYDVTITGEMTVTEGSTVKRIVFTNYHANSQGNATSVNGTIEIDNTPELCNSNGTYVVSTVTPITYDNSGNITGGAINIDGDVYTFHADGTVSVNGETYRLDELQQTCIG
jgi:hypothetical protein